MNMLWDVMHHVHAYFHVLYFGATMFFYMSTFLWYYYMYVVRFDHLWDAIRRLTKSDHVKSNLIYKSHRLHNLDSLN